MADIIHTIRVIPPDISDDIKQAVLIGKQFYVELQKQEPTTGQSKEITIFKSIVKLCDTSKTESKKDV